MSEPGHSAAPPARAQQPQPGADAGAIAAVPDPDSSLRAPPSLFRRTTFNVIALLVFAGFLALAWWQLERRVWKLDLIDRVEQRVHAAPIPAPGPENWPLLNVASDEYRRVEVRGSFLYDRQTLVQASTDFGSGFWVMTPLRMADGGIVLINRGFIAPQAVDAIRAAAHDTSLPAPTDATTVTGLLRMTQPGGGFLRHNDAAADRWFSRDVQAIAAARGLPDVAPYFVDADADADAGIPNTANATDATRAPVGGLTVIAFPNNHLVYAITWLVLALMTAGATWRTRRSWHLRREPPILREKQKRGDGGNADKGYKRHDKNDGDPGNVH